MAGVSGGLPLKPVPLAGWSPHQGRALGRSPRLPQGRPPHPCSPARGSSRGQGPLEQDTRHPKLGSRAQSAPPRDFPPQMGTLKPGDVEPLFRGLAASKDQGSDWAWVAWVATVKRHPLCNVRLSRAINHSSHMKRLK